VRTLSIPTSHTLHTAQSIRYAHTLARLALAPRGSGVSGLGPTCQSHHAHVWGVGPPASEDIEHRRSPRPAWHVAGVAWRGAVSGSRDKLEVPSRSPERSLCLASASLTQCCPTASHASHPWPGFCERARDGRVPATEGEGRCRGVEEDGDGSVWSGEEAGRLAKVAAPHDARRSRPPAAVDARGGGGWSARWRSA